MSLATTFHRERLRITAIHATPFIEAVRPPHLEVNMIFTLGDGVLVHINGAGGVVAELGIGGIDPAEVNRALAVSLWSEPHAIPMHVRIPRPTDTRWCFGHSCPICWIAHGDRRCGCGNIHTERRQIPLLAEVRVRLRVARDPPGIIAVRQPQIIGDGADVCLRITDHRCIKPLEQRLIKVARTVRFADPHAVPFGAFYMPEAEVWAVVGGGITYLIG